MKQYHLTQKQITYFKERVHFWLDRFQLSDWRIAAVEATNDEDGTLASTTYEFDTKVASIYIEEKWPREEPTLELIDQLACHEVCEILLAKISDSLDTIYNRDYIEELIHSVIHRIVNMATKE
jgi:hypothetical protein